MLLWRVVLVTQISMLAVLLWRLWPGRRRQPPVEPCLTPRQDTSVSVLLTTLNEAMRIGPCLDGLTQQKAPLMEVLVVDSQSTDGTRSLVAAAAQRDARIRLVDDGTRPAGWVGKVWALETGLRAARGTWVLGIDADTIPVPGMVGGVVDAAERHGFDVVSFAPQFVGQTAAERLVQPAMLLTLIYRCGAAGEQQPSPDRVLANGQCFLARRAVLEEHGGYATARASYSDDVTLARHLARRGVRVGFLDGSKVIAVRAYASLGEMWREWGRSFDLKDATPSWHRWLDVVLVWAVQAMPLPLLLGLGLSFWRARAGPAPSPLLFGVAAVNVSALVLRLYMLWAVRGSYGVRGVPYWGSWLTDVAAAVRLTWSMVRTPQRWRGRTVATATPAA